MTLASRNIPFALLLGLAISLCCSTTVPGIHKDCGFPLGCGSTIVPLSFWLYLWWCCGQMSTEYADDPRKTRAYVQTVPIG